MFNINVTVYPGDFEDEGINRVLDTLQGRIGVTGVTVPVATAALRYLRRHPDVTPRIFQSRGGFFFQPDPAAYSNTRLKPIVAGWLKARNPLSKVADACQARDIRLHVAIDTRRIERLATRYPNCAAKSPFGDLSSTRACPQNPDAAELFRAAVTDLSQNYALSAIELRDVSRPRDTGLLDPGDVQALGPAAARLFDLCFCESCLQVAARDGIDTDGAVDAARSTLTRAIETHQPSHATKTPPPFRARSASDAHRSADEVDEPALTAYLAHRADAHATFVASLKRSAGCDLAIHLERIADAAILVHANRVIIDSESAASPDADESTDWQDAVRRTAPAASVEARIAFRTTEPPDATALVKTGRLLVDRGFGGVTLDHYALMTDRDFTAAKQASRFARRTATP